MGPEDPAVEDVVFAAAARDVRVRERQERPSDPYAGPLGRGSVNRGETSLSGGAPIAGSAPLAGWNRLIRSAAGSFSRDRTARAPRRVRPAGFQTLDCFRAAP